MVFIIGLAIGIIIGVVLKAVINRASAVGSIYIYEGDSSEKPYMFLALSSENLETFVGKKFVVIKIETKETPPQD